MKTPEDIYKDFPKWSKSWMGIKEDVAYGQGILQVMRPFIESLIADGLSDKTIKRHMDNLWLLGGEIIRDGKTGTPYLMRRNRYGVPGIPSLSYTNL